MGTGRRVFLLIISRIVCPIDIVWSFLSCSLPVVRSAGMLLKSLMLSGSSSLGASVARWHDHRPEC